MAQHFDHSQIGDRLWHFHGGMRLRHFKPMSTSEPIGYVPLPGKLILPLNQNLGSPPEPVVKSGQRVLEGELLARAADAGGAHLHAPASGTVKDIGRYATPHVSGLPAVSIHIEPDGSGDRVDPAPIADWQSSAAEAIWLRASDAGLVGLGGAAFPTHAKLKSGAQRSVHTLLVNGAECEPYISCDEMIMRERADELILGTQIMLHAIDAPKAVIAVEDERHEIETALRAALDAAGDDRITLIRVPTLYPEGGERQLIEVLTSMQVPSDGLPADIGFLCHNIATIVALKRAVIEGEPLISRVITVTGNGVHRPRNFDALIGTPAADLVNAAGGYTEQAARLLMGGPMMGVALHNDEVPIVKACNCLLVMTENEITQGQPEMPCIRCMECYRVCPAKLLPQQLFWHIKAGEWQQVEEYSLFDCIECGCCAAVCPSHIPLVDYYRYGKGELRAQASERHLSKLAKQRYDARESRLEAEKKARAERRAKRQQALAQDREDEIAATLKRVREKRGGEPKK